MNPTTKAHWIYKRFFEDVGVQEGTNQTKQDTTYIHTTYLDNLKHLDQSFINQVERIKRERPNKYQHQILGGWLNKAEGVIFSNWELGTYPKVDSIYGMDFGFSVDPTTVIATHIDKDKGKIYLKEHLYKPNLTTSDIYQIASKVCKDSLIVADSAEPRLITELSSRPPKGLNIVKAKKPQGSVMDGIAMLQDYQLIVDPDSKNLIKELNNYAWLEKKVAPVDNYNHLIDAARYAVYYQLNNPTRGTYNLR
jgi:phage terminase large subunit